MAIIYNIMMKNVGKMNFKKILFQRELAFVYQLENLL
jgi:hypothetical protein